MLGAADTGEEDDGEVSEEEESDYDDDDTFDFDDFYVEEKKRHISRQTRRRYVRQHLSSLHRQADGHVETAVNIIKDLLNSLSPAYKPIAEALAVNATAVSKAKAGIAECTFANFRRIASIAKSRKYDKESSLPHQIVGSILGCQAKKGTKLRALIKQWSGMGDKALDCGAKRWDRIADGGLLYDKNKTAYKNKLENKNPGITKYVVDGWDACTQVSPIKGDECILHAKGEKKHTWGTEEKRGKIRRKRVCIDLSDDVKKVGLCCITHQIQYKEATGLAIMREWIDKTKHDEKLGQFANVLKQWFFMANKPWYVKEPSFRTCVCPYHHGLQSACHDITSAQVWQQAHADCGTDKGKACNTCVMCRDGSCKTFWSDVRQNDKVLLNQLLCAPDEQGDYHYDCLINKCGKCSFSKRGKDKATLPECLTCPSMAAYMKTKEVDGHGGETKIKMRLWVKKEQSHFDDTDWREKEYDAREVGGQEDEAGRRAALKKIEVMEERELPYQDVVEVMMARIDQYVLHSHISKHQSRAIKRCEATLKHGDVIIITDFGANIDHKHQDGRQSEHFSHYQTTILPMVILRKDGKGIRLEALIFISNDTTHSNAFVQYCLNKTIEKMDDRTEGGVKRVHIWSDGCAQQFKNRYQMLYVADGKKGKEGQIITVFHHFFASCHGKNLCDAVTGFVKSWIRREEARGVYMADTEALIPWLETHVKTGELKRTHTSPREDGELVEFEGEKGRGRGAFDGIDIEFVPFGHVNHTPRYETSKVAGIKKMHSFRCGTDRLQVRWGDRMGQTCDDDDADDVDDDPCPSYINSL